MVSELTAFNQSLADQELSGLLLVLSVRDRVKFNNNKLFANELFPLEHFILYFLLSLLFAVVVLTFSLLWQSLNKFHFSPKSFLFDFAFLVLVT